MSTNENREHCKRIALNVEAYAEGCIRRCPQCGGDVERAHWEGRESFPCPHCSETHDVDDWEVLGLYDYLSDVLDIEYIVHSDRTTIKGVRLCVAFGGPTIHIDTIKRAVVLNWWTENAEFPLSHNVCDYLDEWAQEIWDLG